MTYLTRSRSIRPAPRPRGLSGVFDDVVQSLGLGSQDQRCLDAANAAVRPMDAKIDDLVRNWNPTGFYTPDDLNHLVASTMEVVQAAGNTLSQAAADLGGGQDALLSASNDLGRAGQRSIAYLQAGRDAAAAGVRVVNAPGFKRWVTDTLATASAAQVAASVVGCMRPWWLDAMAWYQQVFDKAAAVVRAFVGAVIAIGETTLKVVGDLPELYDILKWVALAGGAYWLWLEIQQRHRGGSSAL